MGSAKLNKWFGYDVERTMPVLPFGLSLLRVVPVVPTPLINVAAAVGGVSFGISFFICNRQIPSAVLYTGLGLALFKPGHKTGSDNLG